DWHALTTDYDATEPIQGYILDVFLDWLSVGLSPEKCTLFVQSYVKEHAELFLLLSMITPLPWLERNPTYKEQIAELKNRDLSNFGFLGYPVLQAADIIMYKANGVPVGIDQAPHVELTREIARRFNHFYGDVFPIPETILTESSKILGMDRRKMSKSYNNAIFLSDSPEEIQNKVGQMITDPQRARRADPGNPDICNVFSFHQLYSDRETVESIDPECREAKIGCVECKKMMAANLVKALDPIREKRSFYETRPDTVRGIIEDGNQKARAVARQTMEEVRAAVRI
ncbi:MAG: tryptophan--tRNA ligase, partial [Proteobacteria bacterium]|nr:tryptophan--tRNA ligase [Pseudomonadota bacterium]